MCKNNKTWYKKYAIKKEVMYSNIILYIKQGIL